MDEQRSGEDRRTIPRETERRKPGPKRKAERSASVCSWVLEHELDALVAIAKINRCSVSEVVRRAIRSQVLRASRSSVN